MYVFFNLGLVSGQVRLYWVQASTVLQCQNQGTTGICPARLNPSTEDRHKETLTPSLLSISEIMEVSLCSGQAL